MSHHGNSAEISDCGFGITVANCRIPHSAIRNARQSVPPVLHSAFRNRGQMLLIVLWAMGLVSLGVGGVAVYSAHELRLGQIPLQQLQRRAIAQAAVYQAVRVLQQDTQDAPALDTLQEPWATGRSAAGDELMRHIAVGEGDFSIGHDEQDAWEPGLIDEDRKLNLNTASLEQLKRLIELAVPGQADAQAVANAIVDWRTPGEPAGGPCQGLNPPCHRKPFDTLDELRLVPGMTPVLFDALRPYLTVYGSGAINVNTASALVLNALGCPGDTFVQQRQPNAHGPFTSPPAGCNGLAVTSTVFTVPISAEVANAAGAFQLQAVIDRNGCGVTAPADARCALAWSVQ